MPIRTHRGRAAVYRRLWGWPLRSPKHLIGAVVVLAAVATTVGLVLPDAPPQNQHRSQRAQEASISARESAAASGHPVAPPPAPPTFSVPTTPPPAPPSPQGLATVDSWGRAWVNHPPGTNPQEWLRRLEPYTTPEYLTVMASVDPANVPATAVTGQPTAVDATASSMKAKLPTDAGTIQVLVVSTPQGWRVAEYDKGA